MDRENPIEQIMIEAFDRIKSVIDVDTVIGTPVITKDGTTIIPISKVSAGFVAGGGEYSQNKANKKDCNFPFAGGSGTGFSVTPIGFLVGEKGNLKMISVEQKSTFENVVELFNNLTKSLKEKK